MENSDGVLKVGRGAVEGEKGVKGGGFVRMEEGEERSMALG